MVLYGDTILIPDPILPWIEADREEERFRHILFIQQILGILHLKPLVDADLPYPAVVVFPSFEKTLEIRDSTTQDMLKAGISSFFSYYFNLAFSSIKEILVFLRREPSVFLKVLEKNSLFIAPGQTKATSIKEAIVEYRKEVHEWRSVEYLRKFDALSEAEQVWIGISDWHYHQLWA